MTDRCPTCGSNDRAKRGLAWAPDEYEPEEDFPPSCADPSHTENIDWVTEERELEAELRRDGGHTENVEGEGTANVTGTDLPAAPFDSAGYGIQSAPRTQMAYQRRTPSPSTPSDAEVVRDDLTVWGAGLTLDQGLAFRRILAENERLKQERDVLKRYPVEWMREDEALRARITELEGALRFCEAADIARRAGDASYEDDRIELAARAALAEQPVELWSESDRGWDGRPPPTQPLADTEEGS